MLRLRRYGRIAGPTEQSLYYRISALDPSSDNAVVEKSRKSPAIATMGLISATPERRLTEAVRASAGDWRWACEMLDISVRRRRESGFNAWTNAAVIDSYFDQSGKSRNRAPQIRDQQSGG